MNIEELKDAIRDTFSDDSEDNFALSVKRFLFLLAELGHAWTNIPKEFMTDVLGWSESVADVGKYIVAYAPIWFPVLILTVWHA